METQSQVWAATGKHKNTITHIQLIPGTGQVVVNDRPLEDYFGRATSRMVVAQPLELLEVVGKYDVHVNVRGGGLSGQADAIKHGITRALLLVDSANRPPLKKAGFITRDHRIKERKKAGQRGARARFQFSKR